MIKKKRFKSIKSLQRLEAVEFACSAWGCWMQRCCQRLILLGDRKNGLVSVNSCYLFYAGLRMIFVFQQVRYITRLDGYFLLIDFRLRIFWELEVIFSQMILLIVFFLVLTKWVCMSGVTVCMSGVTVEDLKAIFMFLYNFYEHMKMKEGKLNCILVDYNLEYMTP